jgi:hypothetical protein
MSRRPLGWISETGGFLCGEIRNGHDSPHPNAHDMMNNASIINKDYGQLLDARPEIDDYFIICRDILTFHQFYED